MDIVQKAASVIAICLLLFFWQKSVLAFFVGLAVVEAGILLQYIPVLARRGLVSPTMFNPGFFHQAVVFSFPLMAAEISWVALGSADRFFVEHYLGGQALGYYAAAYGIANYFQDLLMAPLQLALFPICMNLWVAKGKEETQKFLNRSLDHFVMAAVGVVCIAIVTSRDVILVLASRKFQEAHSLLPYLVIGLVLSAATIYFRPGLMIHQKASKIAMATLYATLMNIGLNSILLPRIGLIGAAVATVLSYAAMVVFLAYESLRVLPFRIEWKAFLRYGTSGIAVGWLALQIRIANPLVSSILRTTLIVTLYLGILWLADAQVRALLAKGYSLGIKWLKAHRRGAPIHQRETILSREPGIQNLG